MLTKQDKELINAAKSMVKNKKIHGGSIKEVGCALITQKKKIFTGVNLHLSCGIGFCAEHSAVATMLSKTNETGIKTIVAHNQKNVIPPCGRCRELLNLIDKKNLNTEIIIADDKKVRLKDLLPYPISKD